MLTKIELLALLLNEQTLKVEAYFLCRDSKTLLKHSFADWFESEAAGCFENPPQEALFIELDNKKDVGIVHVLEKSGEVMKIYIDSKCALITSQQKNIPLFTNMVTVQKKGLQITKKLIQEILLY